MLLSPGCTPYTHDKPDTAPNQQGFARHFGFSPPADVTELYYYADELGIDAKYQLGFKADRSTVDRIVSSLDLKKPDKGFVEERIGTEFPWWTRSDFKDLKPYWKRSSDGKAFKYLWYDESKKQAWYLEFDL